jgi:hypothetical protein
MDGWMGVDGSERDMIVPALHAVGKCGSSWFSEFYH